MLEHVVAAAMAFEPSISLEASHDLGSIGFRQRQGTLLMRKYWRIAPRQSSTTRRPIANRQGV